MCSRAGCNAVGAHPHIALATMEFKSGLSSRVDAAKFPSCKQVRYDRVDIFTLRLRALAPSVGLNADHAVNRIQSQNGIIAQDVSVTPLQLIFKKNSQRVGASWAVALE
jgi:hypothetical protein